MFSNDIYVIEDVFNHLPCNIFWKNKDGEYEWCNNRTATILRLRSPTDIKGKKNSDMLPKKLADMADESDRVTITTGKEYRCE